LHRPNRDNRQQNNDQAQTDETQSNSGIEALNDESLEISGHDHAADS